MSLWHTAKERRKHTHTYSAWNGTVALIIDEYNLYPYYLTRHSAIRLALTTQTHRTQETHTKGRRVGVTQAL